MTPPGNPVLSVEDFLPGGCERELVVVNVDEPSPKKMTNCLLHLALIWDSVVVAVGRANNEIKGRRLAAASITYGEEEPRLFGVPCHSSTVVDGAEDTKPTNLRHDGISDGISSGLFRTTVANPWPGRGAVYS